jgi:plasmid stabilization system protein ParE
VIQLRISEAAALTILEQAEYYRQASCDTLAQRWEVAVEEIVLSLLNAPERGARCRFRSAALRDLRWVLVPGFPKHMVFYRFLESEEVIHIVQVLHGARDLETLLDEEP